MLDRYLHVFRLATCEGVDERYLNLRSAGGLALTKAKGAGWTIHAQNDEWNLNEHGLNVNLTRDGKYLDFGTSDGTSTKKHDFKLFWKVQIEKVPRREVIDLYELRKATVALKNNVRTFKGHTDNAKDVLTTVNTLADDVAQARDTIRSINRTLKIVGAFHPLTKKLATAVRSTLTSIDKGISGLDTTLKTVTKVTGELEPPMETASTWLGNVGSTSTVLYNGTSTAMERKVGLDNDNACGAILDWMPMWPSME